MPKDTNPKLTKSYALGKAVAEQQFRDPQTALRKGYQYENGEGNHHKRGVPVSTDADVVKSLTKSQKYR